MSEFTDKLKKVSLKEGYEFSEEQLKQFEIYYKMLIEKNKVMNLTTITDEDEVIEKHFIDSILGSKIEDFNRTVSVIDVGTGAGFPGIPLKIAFPQIRLCLMDSLNKRIGFLNEVVEALGLQNVETVHMRAEDGGKNSRYREKFDFCLSRAVANLSTLCEYCLPFIKVGGTFISYKGSKGEEELAAAENAIKLLGCKVIGKKSLQLGEEEAERLLIKIKKNRPTPRKYPRKAGLPGKEPL